MKPSSTILFLLFAGAPALASVNQVMRAMHSEINQLAPYLFSEKKFLDEKNTKTIQEHLQKLALNADLPGHESLFKENPAANVTLKVLTAQLKTASKVFSDNKKSFARFMLQASTQTCITCHTSGFDNKGFFVDEKDKILSSFSNEFERAEYFMTTRRFSEAQKLFESVINKFPDNKVTVFDVEDAMKYLAIYYTKISPAPKKGAELFIKWSTQSKLPESARESAQLWSSNLEKWAAEKQSTWKSLKSTDIVKKSKELIQANSGKAVLLSYTQDLYIEKLRASNELSRVVAGKNAAPVKAEALYLLGLIYNSIDKRLLIDLDDIYFKLCIDTLPRSALAQSCYQALHESLNLKSTGSSGVQLDDEDSTMLKLYKKKAFSDS